MIGLALGINLHFAKANQNVIPLVATKLKIKNSLKNYA